MWKVRFNLGAGCKYKTWKITSPAGEHNYLDPEKFSLKITNAKLINKKTTAQKIFKGANKTVCAYIEAENVEIINPTKELPSAEFTYNPRKVPHWVCDDMPGMDMDNWLVDELLTKNNKVYGDFKH